MTFYLIFQLNLKILRWKKIRFICIRDEIWLRDEILKFMERDSPVTNVTTCQITEYTLIAARIGA